MELLLPPMHCHGVMEKKQTSSGLTFALQALLTRHESYVSESQQEHERLTAYIGELEKERTDLQTTNEKIVEENRRLLSRLEAANTSLKDTDYHVKSLESLLRDCEVEVRRLHGFSRRTEELELQIQDLEKDRMILSRHRDDVKEESKSTIKRWRESEVKVRQLEHEVQRIEWEAKKDKERYEEIIARLERERALERELGGAEGRLKGAAALRGLNGQDKSANVVSHFVRYILQDNANLQAGVVELRELLQASNEEVQSLRDQVLQHQPVDNDDSQTLARSVPLTDQIGWSEPSSKVQQSVHVHHHYHAKLAKRERIPTLRRSSRKRTAIGPGMLPSTPESSAPATPIVGPHRYVSSPILPTSLHHPQPSRDRWSMQSAATGSSMVSSYPSSPRSYFEPSSSLFDRLEAGEESSRPTSPESAGFATSPKKFNLTPSFDDGSAGTLDEEEPEDMPSETTMELEILGLEGDVNNLEQEIAKGSGSQELTPKPSQLLLTGGKMKHLIQPEPPDPTTSIEASDGPVGTKPPESVQDEDEPVAGADSRGRGAKDDISTTVTPYDPDEVTDIDIRPGLRRTSSHDSLVSISGMDIHIAKRPTSSKSQSSSLIRGNKAYFALPPLGSTQNAVITTTGHSH